MLIFAGHESYSDKANATCVGISRGLHVRCRPYLACHVCDGAWSHSLEAILFLHSTVELFDTGTGTVEC